MAVIIASSVSSDTVIPEDVVIYNQRDKICFVKEENNWTVILFTIDNDYFLLPGFSK